MRWYDECTKYAGGAMDFSVFDRVKGEFASGSPLYAPSEICNTF